MSISALIAILMALGFFSSETDYYNASPEQQSIYQEIVIDDDIDSF